MQDFITKPERRASGRENSIDPDPGGVRIKLEASTGDIFVDIPADTPFDPDYMQKVLSVILQGLQGDNGGNRNNGADGSNRSADGKKYDVFISHASEDKESLVDNLVICLTNLGIKVWYDKTNITWGDSFREKMDEGLRNARYGIVILSPDYIKDGKYWTKAELDAFFQIESTTGKRALLPVWHHLSKDEVVAFSPFIASRKALSTATMTTAEIAMEVVKLIRNES